MLMPCATKPERTRMNLGLAVTSLAFLHWPLATVISKRL